MYLRGWKNGASSRRKRRRKRNPHLAGTGILAADVLLPVPTTQNGFVGTTRRSSVCLKNNHLPYAAAGTAGCPRLMAIAFSNSTANNSTEAIAIEIASSTPESGCVSKVV